MEPTSDGGSETTIIPIEVETSGGFTRWLARHRVSLAFSTYERGLLFLAGLNPDGSLALCEVAVPRCMGLAARAESLYVASHYQIWRFENVLPAGKTFDGADRLYAPRLSWVTGDIDVHDLALDGQGRLVFANTRFSCLATVSACDSFVPLWRPPFVTVLAPEDRCHLNGIALDESNRPRWITGIAATDTPEGWRSHRRDGGWVYDIAFATEIAYGLSMPHSPRWYRGRLWLHCSGTGEFGWIDHSDGSDGRFQPVAFCPGYLRGLAFVDRFALVGLSQPRDRTFAGLALDHNLTRHGQDALCGILVLDLDSGAVVEWLRVNEGVRELYDIAVLPGCRTPRAIGFNGDDIQRFIRIGKAP